MAKKSKIAAQKRREETVARYAPLRAELKEKARTASTPQERQQAYATLAALPRDASPTRLRNRDQIDGRPRAHLRKFGLSRINFRDLAHRGELPGITKSSW
ncbi:30S ribosomal protein S14 [Populibacterium corticicola]|uniref:Small ribosomal subunit protein uS14 n=1 Tax=Populibacterium corticicola TaxID=1812826 RepID=A0ABW5XGE6_9MICO